MEHQFARAWVLSVDYVGTHQLRNIRPLDVDAPASYLRTAQGQFFGGATTAAAAANLANCTRPYWIYWYKQEGTTCNPNTATNPQPPYAEIQADVNDGYLFYDALDVNLNHTFSHHLSMLISYTYSHAIDNVDPDATAQNPNDPNFTGKIENGNALFDQRHRLVISGFYTAPGKIIIGGVATLASGLAYNYTTGANNSGDGATADRPVINGEVVGRNTGRGNPIYDFAPSLERPFGLFYERIRVTPRIEAFNVFNHANFGNPDTNILSSLFGVVSTTNGPRILQVALHFRF